MSIDNTDKIYSEFKFDEKYRAVIVYGRKTEFEHTVSNFDRLVVKTYGELYEFSFSNKEIEKHQSVEIINRHDFISLTLEKIRSS